MPAVFQILLTRPRSGAKCSSTLSGVHTERALLSPRGSSEGTSASMTWRTIGRTNRPLPSRTGGWPSIGYPGIAEHPMAAASGWARAPSPGARSTVAARAMTLAIRRPMSKALRSRGRVGVATHELVGVEDPGQYIEVADHVVPFDRIVFLPKSHRLPQSEPHIGQRHAVLQDGVERRHGHEQAAGIDLGDVGHPLLVLLDVDAEGPGRLRSDGANGLGAHPHHTRIDHCLGQRGQRGHSAGNIVRPKVGDALERIGENEDTVLPEALAEHFPAWEILAERKLRRANPAHLVPHANPSSGLVGRAHRPPASRARPRAGTAPQRCPAAKAREDGLDCLEPGHGMGLRRPDPRRSEPRRRLAFVPAQFDHRGVRQKARTGDPIPHAGHHLDLGVARRNDQRNLLCLDDALQYLREAWRGQPGDEMTRIPGPEAENEPIVVAPGDIEVRLCRLEAPQEILTGGGSRPCDEKPLTHFPPTNHPPAPPCSAWRTEERASGSYAGHGGRSIGSCPYCVLRREEPHRHGDAHGGADREAAARCYTAAACRASNPTSCRSHPIRSHLRCGPSSTRGRPGSPPRSSSSSWATPSSSARGIRSTISVGPKIRSSVSPGATWRCAGPWPGHPGGSVSSTRLSRGATRAWTTGCAGTTSSPSSRAPPTWS